MAAPCVIAVDSVGYSAAPCMTDMVVIISRIAVLRSFDRIVFILVFFYGLLFRIAIYKIST